MSNSAPLIQPDGWSVASPSDARFDANFTSDFNRWLDGNHGYHNTHAILIEHAGSLVFERYLSGRDQQYSGQWEQRVFHVDALHDVRSISKSVTSLLLGIALQGEYERALATPVTEFFSIGNNKLGVAAETVTLRHALTMTAGFEWDESSRTFDDPRDDEYQLHRAEDPVAMLLARNVIHPPGTFWEYNGGLTELIARIIESRTGQSFLEFADEAFFEPLEIRRFEWLGSPRWRPRGRPSASSGLRLTARGLAKIGSLILHRGVWNNRRVVDAEWIRRSVLHHVGEVQRGIRGTYGYGFQWWPGRSRSIPPYQIVAGFGNGGQQTLVVPEHRLVVTVMAGNYDRPNQGGFNWVLGQIVAAHRQHS